MSWHWFWHWDFDMPCRQVSASVGNRQHVGKFRCHGDHGYWLKKGLFLQNFNHWSNKDQSERIGVAFADSQICAEPLNFGDSVVVVFVHDGMRAVLHKARNEKRVQLQLLGSLERPETLPLKQVEPHWWTTSAKSSLQSPHLLVLVTAPARMCTRPNGIGMSVHPLAVVLFRWGLARDMPHNEVKYSLSMSSRVKPFKSYIML